MSKIMLAPSWVLDVAREIGLRRYRETRAKGKVHTNFRGEKPGPALDCYGALAEVCFSLVTGCPMLSENDPRRRRMDVEGYENKAVRHRGNRMPIPSRDSQRYEPEDKIAFIFVDPPTFEVLGWQRAGFFVGVMAKFHRDLPWPAYCCMRHELKECEEGVRPIPEIRDGHCDRMLALVSPRRDDDRTGGDRAATTVPDEPDGLLPLLFDTPDEDLHTAQRPNLREVSREAPESREPGRNP